MHGEAFPAQHRMRSLMTKACDPGRLLSNFPSSSPPQLLSLLPQLIDLTDAARVQRGEDGISQSENFFMQEKQLKKCGNENTNRNLVFERIKCAETDVYKKKRGGCVCLHLHASSVQPQLFPPFCSSVRHICRADSLSGVFSGPQKEGGLSS